MRILAALALIALHSGVSAQSPTFGSFEPRGGQRGTEVHDRRHRQPPRRNAGAVPLPRWHPCARRGAERKQRPHQAAHRRGLPPWRSSDPTAHRPRRHQHEAVLGRHAARGHGEGSQRLTRAGSAHPAGRNRQRRARSRGRGLVRGGPPRRHQGSLRGAKQPSGDQLGPEDRILRRGQARC